MKIKCIVWDLDNTIWEGILSENDNVRLKENVKKIILELDNRGILQSICSKNDYEVVEKGLKKFGIFDYFLYPQINWEPKSQNLKNIQEKLNIGIDSFAFIDDELFEREEVKFTLPEVRTIDAADVDKILDMEEFTPLFIANDSKNRRLQYMHDKEINEQEEEFTGSQNEFLSTLGLEFKLSLAEEEDLQRMEELTIRTHQLNSTGTTYSYEELRSMVHDDKFIVLVAEMDDKYGSYGKIGISVLEKFKKRWEIKLLLMSCRVISKAVGSIMLNYLINSAIKNDVTLLADFIPTSKNRIMYITYKFSGFKEIEAKGNSNKKILKADLSKAVEYPDYVVVKENV